MSEEVKCYRRGCTALIKVSEIKPFQYRNQGIGHVFICVKCHDTDVAIKARKRCACGKLVNYLDTPETDEHTACKECRETKKEK